MKMRQKIRGSGNELSCHRNVSNAAVTQDMSMHQAVMRLGVDERRAITPWLSKHGPFWEDSPTTHDLGEYLECRGEPVTETAVGEAAFCCLSGGHRRLISMAPSSWTFTPVPVIWRQDSGIDPEVEVHNYWDEWKLETLLEGLKPPVRTWEQLEAECRSQFLRLTISTDCFFPLRGHPFALGVSDRIFELLNILDTLKSCADKQGKLTAEGLRLHQTYFSGKKARFSDSSDGEKNDFKDALTFPHPEKDGKHLFCPWHGKVKSPQIRVHFSGIANPSKPIYVVYVGPKITKR